MEDAEKRRERLREMRAMASAAESSDDVGNSSVADSLANPFVDSPGNVTEMNVPQRFGFYTDPMAAFTGNMKKKNEAGNQFKQGHSLVPSGISSPIGHSSVPSGISSPMTPWPTQFAGQMTSNATLPPAHHMQSSCSPNQRVHHPQGPYHNPYPYRSPVGGASPMPMYQGVHQGAPSNYNSSPGRGLGHNFPHQWRPINHGRGRAWQYGNNPYPGSGPGFGARSQQWHSGRGQWRGRGFHSQGSVSNENFDPESYYNRSMMEDPWQHLEPVLWKPLDDPANNSSKSWLPASISAKKPKLSGPSNKSSTKQSLAEYLSASFNEALDESPSV